MEDHVRSYVVTHLPGDGIGPEVTAVARNLVDQAGEQHDFTIDWRPCPLGSEHYLKTGEVLPDGVLADLRKSDAILLGAVGSPAVPPGVLERGLLLKLRFQLDLYVNLRPFVAPPRVDLAVVRENTEGMYAGEGGFLRKGTAHEVATQGSVNTRFGVERCIRYAFERAAALSVPRLTLGHKTNVLTFAGDLWSRVVSEVGAEFPQVDVDYNHVDAACIYLVESPQRYGVIVTDNLFGDILSDLAGAGTGGIGLAASANLNPARTGASLFEPVHGAAHDIVGTGKANPLAAVSSAVLMLEHLDEADAARRVALAVADFDGDVAALGTDGITKQLIGRL